MDKEVICHIIVVERIPFRTTDYKRELDKDGHSRIGSADMDRERGLPSIRYLAFMRGTEKEQLPDIIKEIDNIFVRIGERRTYRGEWFKHKTVKVKRTAMKKSLAFSLAVLRRSGARDMIDTLNLDNEIYVSCTDERIAIEFNRLLIESGCRRYKVVSGGWW